MDYCLCLLFFIVCFKRVKIDKKSIRCQKKQKKNGAENFGTVSFTGREDYSSLRFLPTM